MTEVQTTGLSRRRALANARLMLIFTPDLCAAPEETLQALIPEVDIIQIRPKDLAEGASRLSPAKLCFDWAKSLLRMLPASGPRPLVLINDRVDVAKSLLPFGVDGVHVGQTDTPPREARALLGPDALIGLSTRSFMEVRASMREPIDYIGFGAVFPTETKGETIQNQSIGTWVTQGFSDRPVFPIGGIRMDNAWQLAPVGRAAVGAGILSEADPVQAARHIKRALIEKGASRRSQTPAGDSPR